METRNKRVVPFKALHPGEVLREELKERGLSQKDFAYSINVLPSHLNEFIQGKRNLNDELAHKFEKELNIPFNIWMDLHTNYLYEKNAINEKTLDKSEKTYAFILGQEVAAARKKENLSQAELGERIGYSASFISKIEQGLIEPRISVFFQIAQALGLNVCLA